MLKNLKFNNFLKKVNEKIPVCNIYLYKEIKTTYEKLKLAITRG